MKPNSKLACETCEDEGEYEVTSGYIDNIDSRGGYHGSEQLSYHRHCPECPRCAGCNNVIGHFSSLAGTAEEWGYFHPNGDESEKLYWCSNKCIVNIMKLHYKEITIDL